MKIGFAGSVDRTGDLERILRETLLRIHDEYGEKVSFAFFGAVPSFAQALNAQCVPYCDSYDAYRKALNALKMDIGLAPMPDTAFHAGKHYNKFVEYAAAGIVGIFSDVKPYDRLETQFGWSLLCSNTAEDWYNAAKKLLDNPDQLERFRQKAVQLASVTFSIPVIAETLDAELEALPVQSRQDCEKVGTLPLLKLMVLWSRFVSGVKRYGFKTPAMILRRLKIALTR